ncbi:hypothetical protein A3J34_04435 [Candidatus Peribacteria bacterium RIFCSPLOWO2_02_FULL_51_10]|nr:MAG: hypothetical protein A3C52_01340 [Candidatus Peribacteria bacterium RIFCSPHIGHO2_02_FULL_51_15]OGJ69829.1 MAG: hypothetical protein A3J34_04435 [Candidatus Peribacteria bacterium RIFCSPLOWO2_02_FULL_51_10]
MKYKIEFADSFYPKELKRMPSDIRDSIKDAIATKLASAPDTFGKPLRYALKGRRRLRVGDYRVIYFTRKTTVIILDIAHRSKVYR